MPLLSTISGTCLNLCAIIILNTVVSVLPCTLVVALSVGVLSQIDAKLYVERPMPKSFFRLTSITSKVGYTSEKIKDSELARLSTYFKKKSEEMCLFARYARR